MFDEATYEALELILEPGDRYLLYADGVLETADEDDPQLVDL